MTSTAGSDRRAFGRRDSSIPARIVGSDKTTIACTVKNFSERGALIEMDGGAAPVGNFRLIANEPRVDVLCQVRHAGPNGIGVMFIGGNASALVETFKPADAALESVQPRPLRPAAPLSNRDLRRSVLARG